MSSEHFHKFHWPLDVAEEFHSRTEVVPKTEEIFIS